MKIDLNNPPRFVKCLKSFYGFNEGEIFEYDEESPQKDYISAYYRLYPQSRATASILHVELIQSVKDEYFEAHTLTSEESFEVELNDAANKIKDEVASGTGGGERVKIGFREGVKWLQERLKNQ